MSAVVITREEPIERALNAALEKLPIEDLVRDCLVAVKPNETWASPADRSGVTQPDTLRAVLRYLKQFKPRELVVSGGSGAGVERQGYPYRRTRYANRRHGAA